MAGPMTARADQLSALHDQMLALVDELSQGTIDRIMGMSDADLAAAVLWGATQSAEALIGQQC